MKNKVSGFSVVLTLILALAFFGCEQTTTEVEGDVLAKGSKGNTPAAVTATPTTDGNYIIISWAAVDNANPNSYKVYWKEEGTRTIKSAGGYAQNTQTYAVGNGNQTANTKVDDWSCLVNTGNYGGKTGCFGVTSTPLIRDGGAALESDIRWSDYIQF